MERGAKNAATMNLGTIQQDYPEIPATQEASVVRMLIKIRSPSCLGSQDAYRLLQVSHDAVFEENIGDELGARTGDVWAPDFWRFHD